MVGGKKLEQVVSDAAFLLVDDCVAGSVDQDLRWHHASEGNRLRPEFERIRHCERVGMAGNRNQVFRAKHTSLFENAAPHFSESEAVFRRLETLYTASLLDRLDGYTSHRGLLEGKVDE